MFFTVQSRMGQRDDFLAEVLCVRVASRAQRRVEAGQGGRASEE